MQDVNNRPMKIARIYSSKNLVYDQRVERILSARTFSTGSHTLHYDEDLNNYVTFIFDNTFNGICTILKPVSSTGKITKRLNAISFFDVHLTRYCIYFRQLYCGPYGYEKYIIIFTVRCALVIKGNYRDTGST